MPLFADPAADNVMVLVTTIVVGGLTTIAGAYFAMRTNRDKLAFDKEKGDLAARVTAAEAEAVRAKAHAEANTRHIEECNEDRAQLREFVSSMHGSLQRIGNKVREVDRRTAGGAEGDATPDGSGPLPALPPNLDRRGHPTPEAFPRPNLPPELR